MPTPHLAASPKRGPPSAITVVSSRSTFTVSPAILHAITALPLACLPPSLPTRLRLFCCKVTTCGGIWWLKKNDPALLLSKEYREEYRRTAATRREKRCVLPRGFLSWTSGRMRTRVGSQGRVVEVVAHRTHGDTAITREGGGGGGGMGKFFGFHQLLAGSVRHEPYSIRMYFGGKCGL